MTFLFTDIEGSTRLWEERPDEMRAALVEHDALVRSSIDEHGGYVFATGGDGFAAAFARAHDAVDAAQKAQAALADHPLVKVRMGIHTGEVQERDGDYFGPAVNRAARVMAVAHGGQVLVSAATESLLDGTVRRRDLGEHRLRDLSAAQRVFQLGDASFPALRSVDVVPSNLPTVLTELVGRSGDIVELSRLVVRDRVVTLTGTGGVGKTRLSLAVAAAVASEFFDGVWLVELAPVADAAGVARALASALGLNATVRVDQAGLVAYLRGRRLVLVLDNCEHVLDAAADFVTAVVAAAPEVHVIATSRELLGVDGEVVRRVRSLGVPEDDADAAVVDAADAVRMFVERATAASGEFALTDANRAAVVEICRKLDGIPLAIELAAARVRGMTPAQIARRLDERFRLLSGARRAQERHRTLQAAVSWSFDLLSAEEQRVFRRLSVFPSSFDVAAAEAVAGDGADVLDDLLRLVDRSLVQHDPDSGRYRLLETLRQFGAERAVESGEADEIRDCYVDHYLRLLAEVGPGYEDPQRFATVVATLGAEMDNIAAVADLLIADGRWRELHDLCMNAWQFLLLSAPALLVQWLDAAVEAGACADTQERVDALAVISNAAVQTGAMDLAARRANESLALASTGGVAPSPWAFAALSLLATYEARFDDYLSHTTDAVHAAQQHSRYTQVFMRASSLDVHIRVDGYDRSEALIDEVLRESREHPVPFAVAVICASTRAVWFERDLARGLRYLDMASDLHAAGPVTGAWLSTAKAMALTDTDPHAGVGLAIQAARLSDRAASAYALHAAVLTLAMLASQTGRNDVAQGLYAHTEAFPHFQANPAVGWLRADTLAALANAGVPTPVVAHERSRRELFAILAELETFA